MLTERADTVIGVDTHAERHAFCLLDARSGLVLAACELPATRAGYREALRLARRRGRGRRVWSLEGTGCYGAGLARVLAQKGEAWGLKDDSAECRERYPDQANQAVIFADGALVAVRPAADVKQVEVKETRETRRAVQAEVGPDGGLVPKRGPDGGYIFAPDGGS